jgi:hypothetical protein
MATFFFFVVGGIFLEIDCVHTMNLHITTHISSSIPATAGSDSYQRSGHPRLQPHGLAYFSPNLSISSISAPNRRRAAKRSSMVAISLSI